MRDKPRWGSKPLGGRKRKRVKLVPGHRILDRYIAEKPVGFGGTATVWRGHVDGSSHQVAIKVSHPNRKGSTVQEERLEREYQILTRICSPYVIAACDFGYLEDGRPILVTEFMRGVSLRDLIRKERTLELMDVLEICSQLLRGLEDAHSCGVTHRDLKPDNIMVLESTDGVRRIKLFDFGIAKVFGTTVDGLTAAEDPEVAELFHALTAADMTVGTPEYMSPEQISASDIGPFTDIYAVGILVHEMLFGEVPYTGKTFFEIAHRHLEGILPLLPADLPESVHGLIWRAMAPEPEERFASAREMYEVIELAMRDPAVQNYVANAGEPVGEDELGPWSDGSPGASEIARLETIGPSGPFSGFGHARSSESDPAELPEAADPDAAEAPKTVAEPAAAVDPPPPPKSTAAEAAKKKRKRIQGINLTDWSAPWGMASEAETSAPPPLDNPGTTELPIPPAAVEAALARAADLAKSGTSSTVDIRQVLAESGIEPARLNEWLSDERRTDVESLFNDAQTETNPSTTARSGPDVVFVDLGASS